MIFHDPRDKDVLADLLLLKLGADRSSVETSSLLVCGPTFNDAWGDKDRLSVSVSRPLARSPIFVSGRHFGGVQEITEEGVPTRLFLQCDPNKGLVQTPEARTVTASNLITYKYATYNSQCLGSSEIIYNPIRRELYFFGLPYNSPSGSRQVQRFSLERHVDRCPLARSPVRVDLGNLGVAQSVSEIAGIFKVQSSPRGFNGSYRHCRHEWWFGFGKMTDHDAIVL